jgi:hypothetical protein
MIVRGGCFCGAITFQADIDAGRVGVCHCRDCQILSGSAFRMACPAEPASFQFTQGAPKYFEKTADSGKVRRLAFCGDCGTHICSFPGDSAEAGNHVSVRVAACEDFHTLAPVAEIYCDSRVPWLSPIDELKQFPQMPRARR